MTRPKQEREFRFTERDFERLKKLVKELTGIHLQDHKHEMVYGRLARRLRRLGLNRFDQYIDRLDGGDEAELLEFTNSVTTNVTHFFREQHHFDFLAEEAVPELLQRRKATRVLRVWSAGCSSGEEPYSLAMTILDSLKDEAGWRLEILATDLDSNMLATGSRGVYDLDQVKEFDKQRLRRWFQRGGGSNAGSVRLREQARNVITFRKLNLMHQWPNIGMFDIILCRNVIIYFDKPTQHRLFGRFHERLEDGGYMMLGHSESVPRSMQSFEPCGRTIYRKLGRRELAA